MSSRWRSGGAVKRRWSDLSSRQRRLIIAVGAVETLLKIAMLFDLQRRSPEEVRGTKWAWRSTALVNSAGIAQLAYFVLGRRREHE
jgi:hypothetical protein